jgi:hypothetical protein
MSELEPTRDGSAEPSWWQSDGHLSDVALAALVDGQTAILPDGAGAHLASCPSCQARSGELVFLTAVADWAMAHPQARMAVGRRAQASVAPHRAAEPFVPAVARARFPFVGLLAALLVAALGALPRAVDVTRAVSWLAVEWRDALSVALRTSAVVVRRAAEALGPTLGWAPLLGAVVLLLIGVGVARGLPRRKGDWA